MLNLRIRSLQIDFLGITNRIKETDRQLVMNKLYNLYMFSMSVLVNSHNTVRIEK